MLNIGIFGAIGVDDIGDIILLQQALTDIKTIASKLNKKVKFSIFSFNKERVINQLEKMDILEFEVIEFKTTDDLIVPTSRQASSLTLSEIKNIYEDNGIGGLFYYKLIQCDALYYLGGGYFNKYWGEKIWTTFVFPIITFRKLQKPVYISSISLGPFNKEELESLNCLFEDCHTIALRDHDLSLKNLKSLSYSKGNVLLNVDDILINEKIAPRGFGQEKRNYKKYMVVHLFHWIEKYAEDINHFYEELAYFIDYSIGNKFIDEVIFLPFNHFRGVKKGGDYLFGQKLQGAYEVLAISPEMHTININEFNAQILIDWFDEHVTKLKGQMYSDKLVNNYRKQKINTIESFISSINF